MNRKESLPQPGVPLDDEHFVLIGKHRAKIPAISTDWAWLRRNHELHTQVAWPSYTDREADGLRLRLDGTHRASGD